MGTEQSKAEGLMTLRRLLGPAYGLGVLEMTEDELVAAARSRMLLDARQVLTSARRAEEVSQALALRTGRLEDQARTREITRLITNLEQELDENI